MIADAASVILLRGKDRQTQVLMGQRGAGAAFMPNKFVFPGGRVDSGDYAAPARNLLSPACRAALAARPLRDQADAGGKIADALTAAALRELAEETGLSLANPRPRALRFVVRAITPQFRPRRFDARFFLADARDFDGDHDGFSAASGELSALQWLPLPKARALDLPFITRVILAELETGFSDEGVPFFDNSGPQPAFLRL